MQPYFVRIHAKPGNKVVFDPPEKVAGYFQTLGVTARNEAELLQFVRGFIEQDTGGTLIEIDEIWPPDFEGADSDIVEECKDSKRPGIWYGAGHAFYSQDSENEE